MPKNGRANQLCEWDKLLRAVKSGKAELPGVAPFEADLDRTLSEAVRAQKRKAALLANARKATKQVNTSFRACHHASIALRNFIKSVLGFKSERLIRYGIRPVRHRRSQLAKAPVGGSLPS
jgi:hypothetical protein